MPKRKSQVNMARFTEQVFKSAHVPRRRQTAHTRPAARAAAAVPTSSCCSPASSLRDGPGIYVGARVPLCSALRARGQRLDVRGCCACLGVPLPALVLFTPRAAISVEEEEGAGAVGGRIKRSVPNFLSPPFFLMRKKKEKQCPIIIIIIKMS